MKTSIIISTYNWPEALNLCLQALSQQSVPAYEIIIGDDGSANETRELIHKWQARLPIKHAWQEDIGYRLARSRNTALAKASGDYVITLDTDMVPHPKFVEDHTRFARTGTFVQGTRAMLNSEYSKHIMQNAPTWEWDEQRIRQGLRKNALNIKRLPILCRIIGLQAKYCAKKTRTCNMAFWMKDLEAVNGFDNRYIGWGREDSDLTYRLVNSRIKRRKMKFSGLALHLYHKELSRASLPENDARLEAAIKNKKGFHTPNGLKQIKQEN